jgi:GT2 family glycosyltransferase/glycosyltransferase involved in cell wall biosynthesis
VDPHSATVIVPTLGGERLARMLESLAGQSVAHQTIVVDNGSPAGAVALPESLGRAEVLRLDRNAGYSAAVNLGARCADGDAVVLLNDDCIVEPRFVERICAALDPTAGIVMAAGVMRDWSDPSLIDSAGMELDRTLLVFDYLNGEPLTVLDGPVADPVGPSGAAAAFDRAAFLDAGGFDERLFAYWEDVDLVLRLRRLDARCALAADAIGDHKHSATLGSGSARKNYLMGFGRGYVLRKWRVLGPARVGPVLVREVALCAGQALIDRNLAGVRGRVRGYRSAEPSEEYPAELPAAAPRGALATLGRRARRRARLRGRDPSPSGPVSSGALAVFHLAETSGPSRSLEAEMRWLGTAGGLTAIVPGAGATARGLAAAGEVVVRRYATLTVPDPRRAMAEARRLAADVRAFRDEIRRRRPRLVVQVTTMLPAVALAARLERVPLLVYCGELFDRRGARGLAARALLALTGRWANGVIACSAAAARQFGGSVAVELVYPPISDQSAGDGNGLRERYGIPAEAPLVLAVGALTEGRGQDLLVAAMPRIRERHPDAHCLIVGAPHPRPADAAYAERVRSQIAALDLAGPVLVAPDVERIADAYVAADVIVNPVRASESFGRVAFEAATAGTPAVVTRVGANEELLEDGSSALTVPPETPEAIAAAVARLLGDPELGTRLAAGARAIVAEHLRPEQSLARFRRAVERAVGDPAPRSPRRPAGRPD